MAVNNRLELSSCRKTINEVETFLIETERKAVVNMMKSLRGLPKIKSVESDQVDGQDATQNKGINPDQ